MSQATERRASPAISFILMLAVAVLALECHRAKPSPEFLKAHQLFTRLYGAKLDDAYGDPQIKQVESWLDQVPEDSLDYPEAQALLKRIRDGKMRLAEQEAKLKATVTQLTSAQSYVRMGSIDAGTRGAKDAGMELPLPGMPLGEFTQKFSRCFEPWEAITLFEAGKEKGKVDSWQLKDIGICRDLYPGMERSLVLTDSRGVVTTVGKTTVEYRHFDAGSEAPPANGDL